ncbi:phosphoribosyltransferase [Lacisediminihabitans sp.]|uniref:phosphoribosyltransferase n=1 Tax=Lacisediminihabitans sp. TaxID=2787631 RepID=UPI00374D7ACE
MAAIFEDRSDAAAHLARALADYRRSDTVVLAIPRGGVPVARRVADALGAPLGVISTRRSRRPSESPATPPSGGDRPREPAGGLVLSDARGLSGAPDLPGDRDLTGARVIIVDDGVATGATARVACRTARRHGALEIVLAVPVAPPDWTRILAGEADAFVAVATPHPFWSVGQWYTRFDRVTDADVAACLDTAAPESGRASAARADFRVQCESAVGHGEQHTPGGSDGS